MIIINIMQITGKQEDVIYKNKEFIQELSNVQQLYFNTLVKEMNLNQEGNDWLFDFIFNHTVPETFGEYLERYRVSEDIFNEPIDIRE